MLHKMRPVALALTLALICTSCAAAASPAQSSETLLTLSDSGVAVNGSSASTNPSAAIWVGADIVSYKDGQDAAYGEGTDADAHTATEAEAQTVVTITQPGTYRVSGALSAGQLAVDLGENASEDPSAVVTLILDNVDITCTVAPAVIFYSVYECGSYETDTETTDTASAGANIILADGSVNNISGSYVAKIYQEGTDKKLHKYDGAFYSKMSINVDGGSLGTGVLNITAENEGLCSELHLTINGGVLNITAQNDGINTSEDGLSVATVNGGTLTIQAGLGAEGDGIDSNGYLIINGGTVTTLANPTSGDGGLDADGGIWLNGGTVVALGNRNDAIHTASAQNYMALSFTSLLPTGSTLSIRDAAGNTVLTHTAQRDFQTAVISSPNLALDTTYTVYVDNVLQQYTGFNQSAAGFGGGQRPDGMTPPDGVPADGVLPTDGTPRPDRGQAKPEGTPPAGGTATPPSSDQSGNDGGTPSTAFTLTPDAKAFSGISSAVASE